MGNILQDMMGLLSRKKVVKEVEPTDFILLGRTPNPEDSMFVTPKMNNQLITIKDLKAHFDEGEISGGGTVNTIAMFTPDGQSIGDSVITQASLGQAINVNTNLFVSDDFNVTGSAKFNYQLATGNSAGGAARAFIEIQSTGPSKFRIYRNGPPNPTGDGYARFKIDRTYDYTNQEQMIQEVIYQKRGATTNVKFKYDGNVYTTEDVYLEFYELPDGSIEAWICCDDYAYAMVTIFYFESLDTIYPEPVAGTPTGTLIHSTNPDTEKPNWNTYKGTGYFSNGVVLQSPNGTNYQILVNDNGILSTVAIS
jgi:hypothetical protein